MDPLIQFDQEAAARTQTGLGWKHKTSPSLHGPMVRRLTLEECKVQ